MTTPLHQSKSEPIPASAPDVIRVPEINQPDLTDIPTDCPTEMPVREIS